MSFEIFDHLSRRNQIRFIGNFFDHGFWHTIEKKFNFQFVMKGMYHFATHNCNCALLYPIEPMVVGERKWSCEESLCMEANQLEDLSKVFVEITPI
jgi:hypothetical protein